MMRFPKIALSLLNLLKAKLEQMSESLSLFGETLKGIRAIAPYAGKPLRSLLCLF